MKDNNNFKLGTIIIIMVITAIISGITSGVIVYSSYGKNTGISYKTINNDTSLREFLEVYEQVTTEYYEDVNKEELIKAAISSMLEYLNDNYTSYLDRSETNALNDTLKGEYRGVGVYIRDHLIMSVIDDSPAYYAGVKANDEILKVNGEDVGERSAAEISKMITTSKSKDVVITLKRGSEVLDITMELSRVYIPAIYSEVIDNTSIGYLRLATFSSTVAEQVKRDLNKFNEENISALILDLRANGGGYLSAAEDVSNMFIEKGKVIYSLKSKNDEKVVKDNTLDKLDYELIVLVDENTASAAEILASALKDSYGATLVGKTTYGKGKVQQTVRLSNGTMAKYTSAKWYRPNGNCIDGEGIIPDYEVDLTIERDRNNNIIKVVDSQLDKAIELLS